jgi:hypothetical protein
LSSFLEQFERVERYLKKVQNQDRDSIEYDDDSYSFFQNCWHLKDWIKADPMINKKIKSRVEKDISKVKSLRICSDLANRTKHATLTKHIKEDARITNRNVTIYAPVVGSSEKCTSSCEHIITLKDGSKCKALDIARIAVKDWNNLLKRYSLIK